MTAPIYVHKNTRFTNVTIVPNETAQNSDLSWAARGLLLYMLSLPTDWRLNENDLLGRSPKGREHLRSVLRELESAGHLTRTRIRNELGHVVRSHWEVWDEAQPVVSPTEPSSCSGTPISTDELPLTGNPSEAQPQTGNPQTGNLRTGNPSEGNPSYYKNNREQDQQGTKTTFLGTEPESEPAAKPKGSAKAKATQVVLSASDVPDDLAPVAELFADWWNNHRHREGKATAQALNLQITNFRKILQDPAGGMEAVRVQIQKAIDAKTIAKGWRAITHEQWLSYLPRSARQQPVATSTVPRTFTEIPDEYVNRARALTTTSLARTTTAA